MLTTLVYFNIYYFIICYQDNEEENTSPAEIEKKQR